MISLIDVKVNWLEWFDRWEQMLACYNPGREHRLHLMLTIPELPTPKSPTILDLGAGPGSTGLSVLRQHPDARILAVEADPVLIEMGRAVVERRGLSDRFQYLQADIRDPSWWRNYESAFDLVVSATALHWLNVEHYREVCRRSFAVLKPGGWFMNCDHVASHYPELQTRYNRWRGERAERAFKALGGDRWDDFWTALAAAVGAKDLASLRGVEDLWEGTDEGHPKPVHLETLERAGFELGDVYWQELGEAIVGGRKPRTD